MAYRSREALNAGGRFTRDYRDGFANSVIQEFDKYAAIMNPLPVNLEKELVPHFFGEKWDLLNELWTDKKLRKAVFSEGREFTVYLTPKKPGQSDWSRAKLRQWYSFYKSFPEIEVEWQDLPHHIQEDMQKWVEKALGFKAVRRVLWQRLKAALDDGWIDRKYYTNSGFKGGPTPGCGCNTPLQLATLWPEVMGFVKPAVRENARNNNMKKVRMPKVFKHTGSIEHFHMVEGVALPKNIDMEEDGTFVVREYYTDEEAEEQRQLWKVANTIMVQASLLSKVERPENYPRLENLGRLLSQR